MFAVVSLSKVETPCLVKRTREPMMILAAPLYRGGRMARFHFVEGRENGATWWHEPHPLMTRQKPHVNGYRRHIRVATCPRLKKKLVLR